MNNRNFVVNVTSAQLSLTASLKASQIASDLLLLQSTTSTIVTRILLQDALKSYYHGNQSVDNWAAAAVDVRGALASGGFSSLLQAIVFSRNATGNSTLLIRETANAPGISLPSQYQNGSHAMLGDDTDLGYPQALYPNITYNTTAEPDNMDPSINGTVATAFSDFPLNTTSALLLGKRFSWVPLAVLKNPSNKKMLRATGLLLMFADFKNCRATSDQ